MEIRNVTQFQNFLLGNGLINLHPQFGELVNCMNEYSRLCACIGTDKNKAYNGCNSMYASVAERVVPALKHQFLAKTGDPTMTFFQDESKFISTISR